MSAGRRALLRRRRALIRDSGRALAGLRALLRRRAGLLRGSALTKPRPEPVEDHASVSQRDKRIVAYDDVVEQLEVRETPQKSSRGFRFWIIFLAVCVCLFLSALEYVRFAPTEIYT